MKEFFILLAGIASTITVHASNVLLGMMTTPLISVVLVFPLLIGPFYFAFHRKEGSFFWWGSLGVTILVAFAIIIIGYGTYGVEIRPII